MEVAVLVQRLGANGYRATGLGVEVVAEAPTREGALQGVSRLLQDKVGNAEVVYVQVPLAREEHPWEPLVGRWKDHPDWDEVEQHMREYRRQIEESERL